MSKVGDYIFLPLETLREQKSIVHKHILIVGKQGSGKTTTLLNLIAYAVEKYANELVVINGSFSSLNRFDTIKRVLAETKKHVALIFFDDFTLDEMNKKDLKQFFKIRHLYRKATKNGYGLVVTVIITHRFHGIKYPELRNNADLIIFKSGVTNPYDMNLIKGYIGEENFERLQFITKEMDLNPEYKSEACVWFLGEVRWYRVSNVSHFDLNYLYWTYRS